MGLDFHGTCDKCNRYGSLKQTGDGVPQLCATCYDAEVNAGGCPLCKRTGPLKKIAADKAVCATCFSDLQLEEYDPARYKCPLCLFSFESVVQLDAHNAQSHQYTAISFALHALAAEIEKAREFATTVLKGCMMGTSCGVCLPCLASRFLLSRLAGTAVSLGQFQDRWRTAHGLSSTQPAEPPPPPLPPNDPALPTRCQVHGHEFTEWQGRKPVEACLLCGAKNPSFR